MPGFDRTGPMGAGPMTGGRRGFCNPATAGYAPAYGGYGYGRGLGLRRGFRTGYGPGRGRGFGRGYGWGPPAFGPAYPPVYPLGAADELGALKEQADYMRNSLESINRRIEVLEKKSSEKPED